MTESTSHSPEKASPKAGDNGRTVRACGILAAIVAFFLLTRTPVMYRQPGGQDEDCYAVPGLTILESGIPKQPNIPARNPESVFYKADDALFAEPPFYFYFQAIFYALLPDQYGTARLSTAVSAVIALLLLYRLGRNWTGSTSAALWGTALFALSRWFYFPAITARPDMLCTAFGLASLLAINGWQRTGSVRSLVAAGVLIGLGGLTHPFAIVYAVQGAGWVALLASGWKRLGLPVLLAFVSIATASLWLPLILMFPEAFEVQFRNQYLSAAGDGMLARLLLPWEALRYHAEVMFEHIGPWQFLLVVGSLIACTVTAIRRRQPGLLTLCGLAWSSIDLMCVAVGPHHPVIGYWSYPAALMFLCTGWVVEELMKGLRGVTHHRVAVSLAGVLLLLSTVPGGGYRTLLAHLLHWNDVNYNGPAFAQQLIQSLPADAVCAVDSQFGLDFLVAGRRTVLAENQPTYFRLDQHPYDYVIVSRYGLERKLPQQLGLERVRTVGIRDDLFACYCEIYQRPADSHSVPVPTSGTTSP